MRLNEALSDEKRRLFEQMMRGEASPPAITADAIPRRAPGATVPLTAAQRQVWLHAAMAPDVPLYNESITIHRLGRFDRAAMQAALDGIVARHEAWRTAIVDDGGDVVQIVQPPMPVAIGEDDVGHLPSAERDAAALAIAEADARRPIDLTRAPLFRARIVRLSDEEHRLYLTLHHIIFDGVSIYRIIVPELAALYEAHAAGRPPTPVQPRLGYGDFAVWQRTQRATATSHRQLEHWRRALHGAPGMLDLAGDRPRPALATRAGAMEVFALPGALVDRLRAIASSETATLYMVLLAGFKAMLMRYTGATDIVVGGVTDLRRRPELEHVVGYFLNTMALRSQPHAGLPFSDYLAQVRDTVLGALDASEVPFDEVVRTLGLPRRAGTHPLFNILFSIEPPVAPFPPGWDLTQMDVVVGAAKFDLYLELDERPDGMAGRFLYSTEMFERDTIRRMIGHWLTMLDGIAIAPTTPLDSLPMLSRDETATMLGTWNETARALPDASVPTLIAEQVRRHPDAVAVRIDGVAWTYAELGARADAIAAPLHALGATRGALVGIALDRSFDMVAALIATLRVGAAYLPLDPGFPRARLDAIVSDAAPVALLTSEAVAATLTGWALPRILVDGPAAPPVPPAPIAPIAADDLAYVLYTSGSTGQPKGVEVDHGALLNLLLAMRDAPGFRPGERLLAVTTLSFDIATLELLLPLIAGGTVILAPRAVAADPDALAELIATERPHVMQATPATWRALVEAGWPGDPGLRILCGGEAMPRPLADALLPRSAELWNMYGPTETTIWSLVHRVTAGTAAVSVGRPIANTTLAILDPSGNPVPIGVAGELNIGGAGVARGYRGRPDLTVERFRAVPALPGIRLYRTGDLARYAADGTVTCLGRTDAEEKIRGYRVAVEEVEGALVGHPAIAAAAVRGWPDPTGNRALAAYLVLRDPGVPPPALADLRARLAETLPDYMLPATIDVLPALPMTANAKIDRKALPEPTRGGAVADAEPPRGEREERLAVIWRDILGVERIARHDSFFDLGGHSLLVARLLRRIERDFAMHVDLAAFFRAHRLDEMTAMLASGDTRDHGGFVAIQPDGDRPPLLWLDAGPTFVALARAVGADQPMFGVPVDPILAHTAMPYRFEDIAAQVVAAIRAVRPVGPYYIGGWCTSGILAFEVARQLRAAGAGVPLLVLAHAMNPTEFERIGWLRLRIAKLRFHARQFLREGRGRRLRYAGARASAVLEEMRLSRKRVATGTHGALRAALDQAAYGYAPQRYAGPVALFQPHERVTVLDGVPGWGAVIDGAFEARDIAGGHRSMLEIPHVAAFGALLRAALTRAQEADATGA